MGGETKTNMSAVSSYPVLASRPVGKQVHTPMIDKLTRLETSTTDKHRSMEFTKIALSNSPTTDNTELKDFFRKYMP